MKRWKSVLWQRMWYLDSLLLHLTDMSLETLRRAFIGSKRVGLELRTFVSEGKRWDGRIEHLNGSLVFWRAVSTMDRAATILLDMRRPVPTSCT